MEELLNDPYNYFVLNIFCFVLGLACYKFYKYLTDKNMRG